MWWCSISELAQVHSDNEKVEEWMRNGNENLMRWQYSNFCMCVSLTFFMVVDWLWGNYYEYTSLLWTHWNVCVINRIFMRFYLIFFLFQNNNICFAIYSPIVSSGTYVCVACVYDSNLSPDAQQNYWFYFYLWLLLFSSHFSDDQQI